jgi:phosphoribosyl-ATP pyrophosphohydrolase
MSVMPAAPTSAPTAAPTAAPAETLARLAAVIASRRPAAGGDPETSYVARLLAKGPDAILKKIGEEATEVVMAAKDADRAKIVAEMADLWFHCLVALDAYGLHPDDVRAELARREGLSGLEEFALRKARQREAEGQAQPAPPDPAAPPAT